MQPMVSHNKESIIVQPGEEGQRLDRYLAARMIAYSRTAIQQLITEGQVTVNGRVSKSGYILRVADTVQMAQLVPTAQPTMAKPKALPLDVVYADQDVLVINKAAGMVVHPAAGHYEDTLVNAILARYPELQGVGDSLRPGIVHRLDKDTSGLMIVARNVQAQAALTEQIQRHEIVKRYLALVAGVVPLDQGSIDAPIGRDPRHRQQMAIMATGSREARTHFRVLQRFTRHTLLLVQLETGRTHQIRVHLQAIGYPVVGDPVYGPKDNRYKLPLQRQFLHAFQLAFTHPSTGQQMEMEAQLPDDLQVVLNLL